MMSDNAPPMPGHSSPLVDFAIAGAQKCGTTAIKAMLGKHRSVYMLPKVKHDYFIYSPLAFSPLARWGYERRFHPAAHHTCIGESSSSYLFYPHALVRLRRYNPALKLIITLRNPAARAFSHWNMNVTKGRETRSFSEAIAGELRSRLIFRQRHHFAYLQRGLYGRQIERLLELFEREQVLLLRSEATLAEPQRTWASLMDFLKLPDRTMPQRHVWNSRPYASSLGHDEEARLMDFFAPDIELLSRLIGIDFSAWLKLPEPTSQAGEETRKAEALGV